MSRTAYEKRLLLQKIHANRELLRLELEGIGQSVRPLATALDWGRRLAPLWTMLQPAARSLRARSRGGVRGWLRFSPLLLLLVPLLWRSRETADSAADGETDESS